MANTSSFGQKSKRREPESPDTYTAPLVSVDSGNDTAEVRVKEYKRSGRFSWKIIDGGKRYDEGEKVLIGDTGERADVSGVDRRRD